MQKEFFFNLELPESSQYQGDPAIWAELEQLTRAIHLLAEQVAFARLGIVRTTNQFSGNSLTAINTLEQLKCVTGISTNQLLHVSATGNELIAELADVTQQKFANAIALTNEVGGRLTAQIGGGLITGYSGLTEGKTYYLSVAGTFTAIPSLTAPIIQKVGVAVNNTTLHWQFDPPNFIA
jgi:hypothetical protein